MNIYLASGFVFLFAASFVGTYFAYGQPYEITMIRHYPWYFWAMFFIGSGLMFYGEYKIFYKED